jgi:hypothetical protein
MIVQTDPRCRNPFNYGDSRRIARLAEVNPEDGLQGFREAAQRGRLLPVELEEMIRARSTRLARSLCARSRDLLQQLPLCSIADQRNHSTGCRHRPPDPNPQPPSTKSRPKRQNRTQHIEIVKSLH